MSLRRSATTCGILGPYQQLDDRQLPTIRDVIKCILYVKSHLKLNNNGKDPPNSEIFAIVSEEINNIWTKASIPIVTKERVIQLLKSYFKNYLSLKRYPENKRNMSYQNNLKCFLESSEKLFDVAACKCTSFESCSCLKPKKVPINERSFLLDQRIDRKMVISGVDKKETARLMKRLHRKNEELERATKKVCSTQNTNCVLENCDEDSEDGFQPETHPITEESSKKTPSTATSSTSIENRNNTLTLPTVAKICDRYGLSTRSAAAVTSAVLTDVGLVSKEDVTLVIDKNKIHRAVLKARKGTSNEVEGFVPKSIYFDGRKDRTLINEKIGVRFHRKEILEEHISILAEPGSFYLGHTSPNRGTAKDIFNSITTYLEDQGLDLNEVICVGCDGTATNTGWKGGVIQYLEKYLEKPLQWCVCMLHTNELPLRHLFLTLDGRTSGPTEYSGPIGKELVVCENKTPVYFCAVSGNLPDLSESVVEVLSTDQKYLYEMCQAVSIGFCSPELANRQPGKMTHSRWLTSANRILRLYVSTLNPSENLKMLVNYVVKVYAPIWFLIKQNASFKDGAKHIFQLITYSRFLPENLRYVVDSVVERNAFFAHPENLLVSMLFDERDHIRELAFRRIIKAREAEKNIKCRIFKTPKINFSATDYTEIIEWGECQITAPPVLRHICNEDLQSMAKGKSFDINDFPCHTQSLERCVKLVTEASQRVTDVEQRDGFIRTKLHSRAEMPNFGHKNNFKF